MVKVGCHCEEVFLYICRYWLFQFGGIISHLCVKTFLVGDCVILTQSTVVPSCHKGKLWLCKRPWIDCRLHLVEDTVAFYQYIKVLVLLRPVHLRDLLKFGHALVDALHVNITWLFVIYVAKCRVDRCWCQVWFRAYRRQSLLAHVLLSYWDIGMMRRGESIESTVNSIFAHSWDCTWFNCRGKRIVRNRFLVQVIIIEKKAVIFFRFLHELYLIDWGLSEHLVRHQMLILV